MDQLWSILGESNWHFFWYSVHHKISQHKQSYTFAKLTNSDLRTFLITFVGNMLDTYPIHPCLKDKTWNIWERSTPRAISYLKYDQYYELYIPLPISDTLQKNKFFAG